MNVHSLLSYHTPVVVKMQSEGVVLVVVLTLLALTKLSYQLSLKNLACETYIAFRGFNAYSNWDKISLKDLEDPDIIEDSLLIKCAKQLGKKLPKEISNLMCTNYKGIYAYNHWEEKSWKDLDDPILKKCSQRYGKEVFADSRKEDDAEL